MSAPSTNAAVNAVVNAAADGGPDSAWRDGMTQTDTRTARGGAVATARVTGPLNRETAAHFDQRLRILAGPTTGAVALDLTRADYVDSDGIRWLQRLQSDLAARRIELRLLVSPGSPPQRTLKLLQLDRVFPIHLTAA
jgi:anti-anti-sigma factor